MNNPQGIAVDLEGQGESGQLGCDATQSITQAA